MNKIESFVYKLVKNNYIIKNAVRNVYQGFYDLIPNYESRFINKPIAIRGCFGGFHDLNLFSRDNTKIICNKLCIPLRMPTSKDFVEVGYWTGPDFSEWRKIGQTNAWNYHKGCRLQWINDSECIFNITDNENVKSSITCLNDNTSKVIDWPIDTVSKDGNFATSFSYERLQKMMPGYGYVFSDEDSFLHEDVPSETGLFIIDLKKNSRILVLSLDDIAKFKHEADMDDSFHFVTHTEFSCDGRFVSFLHRWYKGTRQKTRLIVFDLQKERIWCSPTSGMVSHYVWNSKGGIVAYCRINDKDSHVYFYDHTMEKYKRCGYPKLNSDGHHSFINDEEFVVDTYPDKYRHAKIFKVNIETDTVQLLADCRSYKKFASPSLHKHWACDLHPRCSADGKYLSFDSVFPGERSLCIMRL